jgi:hypothetical protein
MRYARYQDAEGGGLKAALIEYRELLQSGATPGPLPERLELWSDFARTVRKRFVSVGWPDVFQACERRTPGLLHGYLQRLRAAGCQAEAAAVASRLALAGVPI